MKKSVCVLVIVIILSSGLISGCDNMNNNYDAFNFETDFQYYYFTINGTCLPVTNSETGYYFFLPNRFLYYIDKESMESTPLCSKVNCLHNDRSSCDAYFNTYMVPIEGAESNILQYYDGNLYMMLREEDQYGSFAGATLYKVSLDGATREKLISFDFGVPNWLVHRGGFYYAQEIFRNDKESELTTGSILIKQLPLNNLKAKPIELFNTENYYDNIYSISQVVAYDDYLFTMVNSMSEESIENYRSTGKLNFGDLESNYYSINTKTSEVKQIFNSEGEISIHGFYNGKLLYSIINKNSDSDFRYFTCELDGNNPIFLRSMEYGDNLFSNGTQLYLQNFAQLYEEGKVLKNYDEVVMLNSDFEETSRFKIPFKNSVKTVAQDSDYFVIFQQIGNSDMEVYCVDKAKLENLNGEEAEYITVYSSMDN